MGYGHGLPPIFLGGAFGVELPNVGLLVPVLMLLSPLPVGCILRLWTVGFDSSPLKF